MHTVAAPNKDARALRIYFNQAWGTVRTESRSFGIADGDVIAGMDEKAHLPLFGFELRKDSYRIAKWHGTSARVYPPPRASMEWSQSGPRGFAPVPREAIAQDEHGSYLVVAPGSEVRLREGDQVLAVRVDVQRDRAPWDKQKAAFWLVFLIIATVAGPLAFLLARPDPELVSRALGQAREKQGLPATPEDLNLAPVPEDGSSPHGKGMTIPASVR